MHGLRPNLTGICVQEFLSFPRSGGRYENPKITVCFLSFRGGIICHSFYACTIMNAMADTSAWPDSGNADTDDDEGLDKTAVLLRRLNELKTWQREQEDRLRMGDQQEEEQEVVSESDIGNDDDATLDQDLSSLVSFEEHPDVPTPAASSQPPPLPAANLPTWALGTPPQPARHPVDASSTPRSQQWLDEVPIKAPKRFEEILAEHIGEEEAAAASSIKEQQPKKMTPNGTKPFLRKGTGLARYGSLGSGKKRLSRSKSQHLPRGLQEPQKSLKLSSSCSKLNTLKDAPMGTKPKQQQPKKTLPVPQRNALKQRASQPPSDSDDGANECSSIFDSVEISFKERLREVERVRKQSAHKKSQKMSSIELQKSFLQREKNEITAFERLEEAACESSFSSSCSRAASIRNAMPSPIQKRIGKSNNGFMI